MSQVKKLEQATFQMESAEQLRLPSHKTHPRWHHWLTLLGGLAMGSGCAMCCGPYDYHYPTIPGRVQRADPIHGRVGSIFSDPYTAGNGPSADSNLKQPASETMKETEPLPSPQPDVESPIPSPDAGSVDRETRWQNRGQPNTRGKWR